MTQISFLDRVRYWLFGGTGTLKGAYSEASRDAMARAVAFKEGKR